MRLFVRTTLAAALLAACHAAPPAAAPSPAIMSATETSAAGPVLPARFTTADAPRLDETRALLPARTQRANGTRTLLIVAVVAAAAVIVILAAGGSSGSNY